MTDATQTPRKILTGTVQQAREQTDINARVRSELAARTLARRRIIPFISYIKPDYMANWFHYDVAARLERFVRRVERGESPRMILAMPPGTGKTELVSRGLPSFCLGWHPDWHFLSASHTSDLAQDISLDVINYITSSQYQRLFPDTEQRPDKKGVAGWRTTADGRYTPLGVGAGISGRRAHILIIDDPHKDQEAFSRARRDAVEKWFLSSAYNRLFPGGGVIIVQTRWALDDLAGRRLASDEADKWEYVKYPMDATDNEYRLADGQIIYGAEAARDYTERGETPTPLRVKGELLHPERWPEETIMQHRANKNIWAALFQQDPTADGAGFFDVTKIHRNTREDLPPKEELLFLTAADLAMRAKERADYSAALTGAVDDDGDLWFIDLYHEQVDSTQLGESLLDIYEDYVPYLFGIEETQHVIGLKPYLDMLIARRKLFHFPLHLLKHGNKDKRLRATPLQSMIADGKVHILTDMPHFDEAITELEQFDGGATDDIVDAAAYLATMAYEHGAVHAHSRARRLRGHANAPDWRDKLRQYAADQRTKGNNDWRAK